MADPTDTRRVAQSVRLRPIEERDLPAVASFYVDREAAGEFQWFGYRPMSAREVERQWRQDGLFADGAGRLAVDVAGAYAGDVDWRPVGKTGALEIGIGLLPEHRGHGVGTEAQRRLVEYLFTTSPVHRLQAGTEIGNVAEQRALERVGFQREGVLRAMYFRDGQYRDSVVYGLLRDDWTTSR